MRTKKLPKESSNSPGGFTLDTSGNSTFSSCLPCRVMIRSEYLEVKEIYGAIIADLKGMSREFLGIFRPRNHGNLIDDFDLLVCVQKEYA